MIETLDRTNDDVIHVLIVEDHAMVAEGLRVLLDANDDISVIGVALTIADGVEMAASLQPAVIVLDFKLPDGDAPDSIADFLQASPASKLVVLSAASDYNSVVRSLEAGANGFLLKNQRASDLADAVRTVYAGGRALAAQLVSTLMHRISGAARAELNLTRREIDVLARLAEGASTERISKELALSVHTVRNHVQSAIRRLGAHSKLEAISIARREGFLSGNHQEALS
jgi:DNA-binding NarL/FixJ family response regulator